MTTKPHIYVIVGPTASGKTSASINVAKRMNAEIISADSIQIYRGMDIGSAKPTQQEMQRIVHHMVDIVDVNDGSYNVSQYRTAASECIYDIINRGKTPLIVGGTGLYINSLIFPLDFSRAEPDFTRREELAGMEESQPGILHRMLNDIDPQTAHRLHPNDLKRIIRAIEVYERTGETLSSAGGDFTNARGNEIEFEPMIAGICMDRAILYSRIEQRVDDMMEIGFLDETKRILSTANDRHLPALQGLGYKQLAMHLDGELGLDEAVELIKRDTRRFAKRQISWFKRDARIHWFDASEYSGGDALSDAIYGYFTGRVVQ